MEARVPEVVDGYRTPRGERQAKRNTGGIVARTVAEGKTLIQFTATRYRLQLTCPPPIRTPGGDLIYPKGLFVQADNGFATLDNEKDKEILCRVKGGECVVRDAYGNDRTEKFGPHEFYGRDFWDFDDALATAKREAENEAFKVLSGATPEIKAKLLDALKQSSEEEFPLPERKPLTIMPAEASE